MDDKEFLLEQKRLSRTLGCIDAERKYLDSRLTGGIEAANEYSAEALRQQFLKRLRVLILIKDKPYFARVDFAPRSGKTEQLYLGKTTVLDEEGGAAVVDWRAPISNLYYDGRVGKASYVCPDGEITGEILLKRQLEIENRELLSYRDIDITFDEELLKPYLGVNSSTRLKNIIATIQTEQNRIIRADMSRPLIVQGVAGSGKTTVALHRIAYLIYTWASRFRPENFLIIAPNAIFLDYISNVLPDLGVENVRQQTFEQFVRDALGKKLKVEDTGEKFGRILRGGGACLEARASAYKSSLKFRDAVDRYLAAVEKSFLPRENFRVGTYVLCPYQTLVSLFVSDYGKYPFSKRLRFIKERLFNLISDNAERILAEIDAQREQSLEKLPRELSAAERKERKRRIYEQDEATVKDLLSGGKEAVKTYLKKLRLPSAAECYRALVSSREALREYGGADEKIASFIAAGSAGIQKGRVEYEDLAPLLHIHCRIHGTEKLPAVRHVVIDEAQDFSAFQFFTLKEALGCDSMTIFGDIAQGIYPYRGTGDWNSVIDGVFGGNCGFLTLRKSYRSTVEIMEQANGVLSQMPGFQDAAKAVPVIRHGEPVRFVQKESVSALAESIAERIKELRGENMENIAVICKTARGCSELAAALKPLLGDFHILGGKEYAGGTAIVPAHLAKGLEFEAVILPDARLYRKNAADIRLLYVAMTRAVHVLDVYSVGGPPDLFRA